MRISGNAFRMTRDGTLDRQYLRACAIYRLLKSRKIDRVRAAELQNRRYASRESQTGRSFPPRDYLNATISIWFSDLGPLSEKGRAGRKAWHDQREAEQSTRP